ncbi:MAG: 5-(carboxyamino)imidazole ribonucleotide synthase [Planctomycetota bacterium]
MTRVGILGGGQLGQMLAIAGEPLGVQCRFLDQNPHACAANAGELITGAFDDPDALLRFADGLDVVTFEFERVPTIALERLARHVPVRPGRSSLATGQDRRAEKSLFNASGLDTAPWLVVESHDDLRTAIDTVGTPGVLKQQRGGYDGKGQCVVQTADAIDDAWASIGCAPAIYEQRIPFERELSLIGVRGLDGSTAFYPLVENVHRNGILHLTRAPALGVPDTVEAAADAHMRTLMESLDHVGAFCIEFFQLEDRLIANETAPRVHNSGHWTIEGAQTSQFENHIRAILGLPLGPTGARGHSAMLNLIGDHPAEADMHAAAPQAHIHLYGKQPRPGRKLGHVTLTAETAAEMDDALDDFAQVLAQ